MTTTSVHPGSTTAPLLSLCSIRKQYPGVLALHDVSFELRAGEVHCLVGENGAGKSTLMKILAGAERSDAGTILIDGHEQRMTSPHDAQDAGIGMIYQDFKLVPELTVADNVFLGREPRRRKSPFIDITALHSSTRMIFQQFGEEIDTTAPVRELSVAKQQVVEIAKALSRKVRMLAMDEPSAVLTERELKNLFAIIRSLKSEGVGIIYISHRLEEIFEIGDRVTVLRDGAVITTSNVREVDRPSLIRWMVGRSLDQEFPKAALQKGGELLRLEHISGGIVEDVNLTLRSGEILGLAGLVGAGRSELARLMFAADQRSSGTITLDGNRISPSDPREAIDVGIGLLTEDRNKYGIIMQMSVKENITLSHLRSLTRGVFIDSAEECKVVDSFIGDLKIKTPSERQTVDHLSGGNRQKVVLARWLLASSRLLIFDEPTAGIDVGIKYEIYLLINRLAASGIGIIMISSDLPELLGMCDRIAVMCEGRLTGVLDRSEASQEKIMALATARTGYVGTA